MPDAFLKLHEAALKIIREKMIHEIGHSLDCNQNGYCLVCLNNFEQRPKVETMDTEARLIEAVALFSTTINSQRELTQDQMDYIHERMCELTKQTSLPHPMDIHEIIGIIYNSHYETRPDNRPRICNLTQYCTGIVKLDSTNTIGRCSECKKTTPYEKFTALNLINSAPQKLPIE